jgi:hypothetical protein
LRKALTIINRFLALWACLGPPGPASDIALSIALLEPAQIPFAVRGPCVIVR